MDVRRSWHQICPTPFAEISLKNANFIIHFDGGTRGDDCSAAAWILEASVVHGQHVVEFPVAYCGKYMFLPVSSFVAETIGLESCTEIFAKLVLKVVTAEPPRKQARSA